LAVSTILFSLRHQLRLLEDRCFACQQEVSTLRAAALQLNDLKVQIAGFIFGDFADGALVRFHDVHNSVVIDQPAEALKVAVELLLFLVVTLLIDVAHHNEGT
jgi:hypothetical protein